MSQDLAVARRKYWCSRERNVIAHNTTDYHVATHYRLQQFESWLDAFEDELEYTGPRKIAAHFDRLGKECCDLFCDEDIEIDLADETLVERIVHLTEACIQRHKPTKDEKIDWDAFDSIVCAF